LLRVHVGKPSNPNPLATEMQSVLPTRDEESDMYASRAYQHDHDLLKRAASLLDIH